MHLAFECPGSQFRPQASEWSRHRTAQEFALHAVQGQVDALEAQRTSWEASRTEGAALLRQLSSDVVTHQRDSQRLQQAMQGQDEVSLWMHHLHP